MLNLEEVIITSPGKRTTRILENLRKEFSFNIVVYEKTFDDAVPAIENDLSQRGDKIQVVASGGATLALIHENLNQVNGSLPYVNIFPKEYDLLMALGQAKASKLKIGILVPGKIEVNQVRKLCAVLNISAKLYVYNNWTEVLRQIKRAELEGVKVIVGAGERIGRAVESRNLHYISVVSSEHTIRKALRRAQYIQYLIKTQQREKLVTENMNLITNYSQDGVMAINDKKVLYIFNKVAAQFFRINRREVLGRKLGDLKNFPDLYYLFEGSEERMEYLYETRYGAIIVNKIPIFRNDILSEILIHFRQAKKPNENSSKQAVGKGLIAKYCFEDIIHNNSKMTEVINKAQKFANTDCTVLIRGATGTGKELISQSMHNAHQKRRHKPFVAVNCAAFDDNLLRSELFGYSEGAFTGASKGGKPGLFEMAQGGTLFLDEIGKMKWELQGHLLRVLQEKEVRRIGSDKVIPIDVRIIAASNENLEELVINGTFREDLYYRLNVLKLVLPPLRERTQDIPPIVNWLIKNLTEKYQKPLYKLSDDVMEEITRMDWHGNIRQLQHFIERCIILCDDSQDFENIVIDLLEEEAMNSIILKEDYPDEETINIRISTLEEMNAQIAQYLKAQKKISNSELALRLGISRPTLLKILNRKLS